MRRMIAAFRISLDGFVEGPNGEMDWVESWDDGFELSSQVDTCVLGSGLFRGYEQYWSSVLADPDAKIPESGKKPTRAEIAWAHFAAKTPHVVLSKTLQTVSFPTARIVRDLDDVRALKQQPGRDIYVVGGPTLVSSLLNAGLLDELRLMLVPVILGGGKPLATDVASRVRLELARNDTLAGGLVRLRYAFANASR